ncbi:hypothetical protein BCR43DRAFT_122317 [Syncephalastrum racemosum]|uniref:WD40-repeat-containing domain protein n=1 Tax=Syncephalastrum racemosum TaxID=13706 RepID=A0A1X2GZF2_SYNRA|nr:hypothetical protein BCR43DRAFT_122317 [Syncephalastrum racemosum]
MADSDIQHEIAAESNEAPLSTPPSFTDNMDMTDADANVEETDKVNNAATAETEEEQPQQEEYTLFAHTLRGSPPKAIATTGDTYNTTVGDTLGEERDQIYPRMQLIPPSDENNYFRNLKWSPDGSCLLTSSNDNILRIFNTPIEAYSESDEETSFPLKAAFGIREAESAYDFAWFPSMSAQDPATCCFLTSVRDQPVHLWDANSATVYASYPVIDHTERFVGANVVRFNLDGSK